jgi:hypothetical protein
LLLYSTDEAFQLAFGMSAYSHRFVNGRFHPIAKERAGIPPITKAYCQRYGMKQGEPELPRRKLKNGKDGGEHSQLQVTQLFGTILPIGRVRKHEISPLLNVVNGIRSAFL